MSNTRDPVQVARRELAQEKFRKRVEQEKERLRKREDFWTRLFPWRLRIERRDR